MFLAGAGTRGTVELLGAELLGALDMGTERIGVVCEAPERWRAPLEAVLPALGIPYAVEHAVRLGETPLGRALLGLLRFACPTEGEASSSRSSGSARPASARRSVDFVEGRLRGRAVEDSARVEEESERLRGAPIPALAESAVR